MNTPPCPVCRAPLRWFADHHAWGCDSCRQMMAAGPPVARSRPRSLRWAVIGGLVVGFVVVLVIALRGGDKPDCDKYADKQESLARLELAGEMADQVGRRVRLLADSTCRDGSVSKDEADCVLRAATHDQARGCSALGDSPAR